VIQDVSKSTVKCFSDELKCLVRGRKEAEQGEARDAARGEQRDAVEREEVVLSDRYLRESIQLSTVYSLIGFPASSVFRCYLHLEVSNKKKCPICTLPLASPRIEMMFRSISFAWKATGFSLYGTRLFLF
jgi:hypothetical protein